MLKGYHIKKMKDIPRKVKLFSNKNGYNSIKFLGSIDNAFVYGLGVIDKDGTPIPTGLPNLILLQENEIKIVSGEESLKLLSLL